ncbi:MAG: glycosyltransferase family 4 protein [Xenococcaceae cyanobacterium]
MKILHLSTSDLEGGAARSAYRLHRGLQNLGVTSQMLVRAKDSVDPTVIADPHPLTKLGPQLNNLPLKLYPQHNGQLFAPQWFPDALASKVEQIDPDLINLHWICNGFLQIETPIKFKKPIVWTLHDMWAFTGGCHYTQDCDRYTSSCGACPQLNSNKSKDLSSWVWQRKLKAWQQLNLTLVSPSIWLAECARASPIFAKFPIEVIPHGLNTEKYQPIEQKLARKMLQLPHDKQLVAFGSGGVTEPNKGFHFLESALQQLSQTGWQDKIELVVFGSSQSQSKSDLGFKTHYLGRFHDDLSLAIVYSSADVLVVPSKQEAFGQTASEALACGTPVVAFKTTGLKDIVDSQENGYLARPFEVEDLARGIAWVLEDSDRHRQMRDRARQKATKAFSIELQAHRYLSLFDRILNNN